MRYTKLDDWLLWQETLHPKSIDLGLARVRKVYQALRPVENTRFTITVGGTNGKGSCVALLDAMLRAQGYRVGAYSSPHLLRYNERIRVNGECAEDAALCEAFERIDHARGDISLSFFEFGTLAALEIFAASSLDVQILEVGLGGRLDAVNLIDTDAALITGIDIDHQDWLGETRDAIAVEKAGILRPGKPAVCGDPDPPQALLRYADQQGITLACLGRDFGYERMAKGWLWHAGDIRLQELPLPALCGEHQLMNAAAAIQVLQAVREQLPVCEPAIRQGLTSVRLAGRFQYIEGDVPVLLDVAHNPQSVKILADYLASQFQDRRIRAVFSIMRDKDIEGVVERIKDRIGCWYLAPLAMTRAASEGELTEVMHRLSVSEVRCGFADAAEAYAAASTDAREGDLVVIFGSFFLVSELLARIA